jgi:hypothetical protein
MLREANRLMFLLLYNSSFMAVGKYQFSVESLISYKPESEKDGEARLVKKWKMWIVS